MEVQRLSKTGRQYADHDGKYIGILREMAEAYNPALQSSCHCRGGAGGLGGWVGVQPSTSGWIVQPFCGNACSPAVEEASWPCANPQSPATVCAMFAALHFGKFSQVNPFCRSARGIVSMIWQNRTGCNSFQAGGMCPPSVSQVPITNNTDCSGWMFPTLCGHLVLGRVVAKRH
jgi:hypothetical protein